VSKIQLLSCACVVLCLLLSSASPSRADWPASVAGAAASQDCDDCSDPNVKPQDCCKAPVRRNGDAGDGCYCFTCEYGTQNAHIVCTHNENIKSALFRLSEPPVAPDKP